EGEQSVGFYQVTWNGRNRDGVAVSSGLYFYQIRVENSDGKHRYISTRRCVLLK
ncbi:MAG: FlgD immunoglobulin-like domain containing protein, partial [Fidelibacterota bacterium]